MVNGCKKWCFTHNNYTEGVKQLYADLFESEHVKYGVLGYEVGENGTPHIQGFVWFTDPKTLNQCRNILPDGRHLEPTRGTPAQAADYCKKGGDYDEFGSIETKAGRRTDWERLRDWCKEQTKLPSDMELWQEFPTLFGRYSERVRAICSMAIRVDSRDIGEPRQWQRQLEQRLEQEPDDRHIRFIVDEEGNAGKSWFIKYYMAKNPDKAQKLPFGKRDDMAFAYKPGKHVYFLDVPRKQMEFLQYSVLEMIKDGSVSSPKYESVMKETDVKAHVVVMCNELPDMEKLSRDRFKIYQHQSLFS